MCSVVRGESPWPLFLYGGAGSGKTCAALSLLDHSGGLYYTVASLCARLTQAQQGRLTYYHDGRGGDLWPEQVWEMIGRAALVVLDEIGGRERISDHHYETVWTVLEERQNRPLVCISNLTPAAITEVYDDRIVSRLASGTVVKVEDRDRRIEP